MTPALLSFSKVKVVCDDKSESNLWCVCVLRELVEDRHEDTFCDHENSLYLHRMKYLVCGLYCREAAPP